MNYIIKMKDIVFYIILLIELVLIIYVIILLNKNRLVEQFNSVSDNPKIVDIWDKKTFTKKNINYINSFATHIPEM